MLLNVILITFFLRVIFLNYFCFVVVPYRCNRLRWHASYSNNSHEYAFQTGFSICTNMTHDRTIDVLPRTIAHYKRQFSNDAAYIVI